jgi:seryl-tRNA synthetase
MTQEDEGTTPAGTEAPTPAAAPAEATSGTPKAADEVTTLRSRNAGLDAKVTELQRATAAAQAAAAAAAQKLADYESGKVQADEALRAQLSAKDAELVQARNQARLATIAAKYPETFGVFAEAAVSMTDDQLAAAEVRFTGTTETHVPVPAGTNAARVPAAGTKAIEDMSISELRAAQASMFKGSMFDLNGNRD